MSYLTNTASSVRDMGIKKSKELGEKFKQDWIVQNYIPKVVDNYNVDKQGYNYRMCSLQSLSSVI